MSQLSMIMVALVLFLYPSAIALAAQSHQIDPNHKLSPLDAKDLLDTAKQLEGDSKFTTLPEDLIKSAEPQTPKSTQNPQKQLSEAKDLGSIVETSCKPNSRTDLKPCFCGGCGSQEPITAPETQLIAPPSCQVRSDRLPLVCLPL